MQDADGNNTDQASYFAACNGSLAVQSDIVVENFKVGGLTQYGLDYEQIAKLQSARVL